MGDGSLARRPDLLSIFPDVSGGKSGRTRPPIGTAPVELGRVEPNLERTLVAVDRDDVAVAQMGDRTADRRLGPDMTDAQATGRAREPAIGDERHLAAHPLAVKGSGGG